jgi:CDP-diglyceride synthetase
MWESEENQKPTDYTGLIITIILLPVFLLFRHLGKTNEALSACLCLGISLLVVRIYWKNQRTHAWFWIVIVVLLLLHIPLVLEVQRPRGWMPGVALLPLGLADLFIYAGAIKLAQKAFATRPSSEEHDD